MKQRFYRITFALYIGTMKTRCFIISTSHLHYNIELCLQKHQHSKTSPVILYLKMGVEMYFLQSEIVEYFQSYVKCIITYAKLFSFFIIFMLPAKL